MARFAIDRKNRDRKGGHRSTGLERRDGSSDAGIYTPVQRAFIKRQGKRMLRRQHNRAIEEGLLALSQEQEERAEAFERLQDDLDLRSNIAYRRYQEDGNQQAYYDDYDPFWEDDAYAPNSPYSCDDPFCTMCGSDSLFGDWRGRQRRAIRERDSRQADEYVNEVRSGRISPDLEIIESRDIGKSLGEILRERLQRPF